MDLLQNIRRGDGAERQRLSILQKLYAPLIALARRHAAFPSLLQMCRDLDDEKRLRSLMVCVPSTCNISGHFLYWNPRSSVSLLVIVSSFMKTESV